MPPLYNACSEISPMEPQEINRAVQSVTARTSFGRDAVAEFFARASVTWLHWPRPPQKPLNEITFWNISANGYAWN